MDAPRGRFPETDWDAAPLGGTEGVGVWSLGGSRRTEADLEDPLPRGIVRQVKVRWIEVDILERAVGGGIEIKVMECLTRDNDHQLLSWLETRYGRD